MQVAHYGADNTKQNMIGKALQIHAAEITLANRKGFRPLGGLLKLIAQLSVEVVGELPCRNCS